MAFLIFLCFTSFLHLSIASPLPINASTPSGQNAEQVMQGVVRSVNMSSMQQRQQTVAGECSTGNPVDDCWRCSSSWADNRQRLADCAIGFGSDAIGGRNGKVYVVTDPSDDSPADPKPGTLRYGLVQEEPLWITFTGDMTIRPTQDLHVGSYKTVDGRGVNVVIGDGGGCFVLHGVSNVIIHGVTIRGCKPASPSWEGDGITVFRSTHVWVDHCTLEACTDGLIDVTDGSTYVTLSNNLLRNHDKTMLLGHSDTFTDDKNMKVTVAFNRFGPGLVQRMPRCRFGLFHVINNDYINWQLYAIGGSASPTILSHGNRFLADKAKEVTKREGALESEWSHWTWMSEGDTMLNGAFFTSSGSPGPEGNTPSFAKPASFVPAVTASAGVLSCNMLECAPTTISGSALAWVTSCDMLECGPTSGAHRNYALGFPSLGHLIFLLLGHCYLFLYKVHYL